MSRTLNPSLTCFARLMEPRAVDACRSTAPRQQSPFTTPVPRQAIKMANKPMSDEEVVAEMKKMVRRRTSCRQLTQWF